MGVPAYCPFGKSYYTNDLTSPIGLILSDSDISYSAAGLTWTIGAHPDPGRFLSTTLQTFTINTDINVGATISNFSTPSGTTTFELWDNAPGTGSNFFQILDSSGPLTFLLVGIGNLYVWSTPSYPFQFELRFQYVSGTQWNVFLYLNGTQVGSILSTTINASVFTGIRIGGIRKGGTVRDFYLVGSGLPNSCPAPIPSTVIPVIGYG